MLYSNNGAAKVQIDYVLVKSRFKSSVLDSRPYLGANLGSKSGSDHNLIITRIQTRYPPGVETRIPLRIYGTKTMEPWNQDQDNVNDEENVEELLYSSVEDK